MHLIAAERHSTDEADSPVDLGQDAAEMVFLSFSDSDLGLVAAVHEAEPGRWPSLRVASLAQLRHPFSVDLYVEKVVRRAGVVVVRLLGGADYWRYGLDEVAAVARAHGIRLVVVPGDARADARLASASTVDAATLDDVWGWLQEGGTGNAASLLAWAATALGRPQPFAPPRPMPPVDLMAEACHAPAGATGHALVLLYRSVRQAGDVAPVVDLAAALAARGLAVRTLSVTSLKDPAAADPLAAEIAAFPPDVIVNTTAFSGRRDDGTVVLDAAGCPVLQAILPSAVGPAEGPRPGLGAADLAMNVVLPEVDGRITATAISFKARTGERGPTQHARARHVADAEGIALVADRAAAWARLRRVPAAERRLALVLSDYPMKGGRAGYAVGLDAPASAVAILEDLTAAGHDVGPLPEPGRLIRALEAREGVERLPLEDYRRLASALPVALRDRIEARWGAPEADEAVVDGAFVLPALRLGRIVVALQPDRGRRLGRKDAYHDPAEPPRHGYVAFHLWLRHVVGIDALIHLGTHGTLEWLPGRAVALTPECAPAALLGPTPVVYPFIVNNPGEAAQAKRRIGAVTIGHLTPPLVAAGSARDTAEIEVMLDEYAEARGLDRRRAERLAVAILATAAERGIAAEIGLDPAMPREDALARLDAFLCDVKEARIGDGLHVFARSPGAERTARHAALLSGASGSAEAIAGLLARSPEAEREALLAALAGRFVAPGPAGAPGGRRIDVLPTGRNLHGSDPRAIPTATAWELGRLAAQEVLDRHLQDHGDWPRRLVIDLWGSATLRTGGEDLAQAMALLGVRPLWDAGSGRVSGFEVMPPAMIGRPRVDVTLRVSGLFRDLFPAQIALFDAAVAAVAARDGEGEDNPLAQSLRREGAADRVYGAAPESYGTGVAATVVAGAYADRAELGRVYLEASGFRYGRGAEGVADADGFARRVAAADAHVKVQDDDARDVLDADAFAESEGGFAAAAHALGSRPALYHVDASRDDRRRVRTLGEEVARVVRARAANPRWIEGQMRHGHRGAAEIAETVDNLLVLAATAAAVTDRGFELVFDATLGDDAVRGFIARENPEALKAIARAFAAARHRGYWSDRRNSTAAVIAAALGDAE